VRTYAIFRLNNFVIFKIYGVSAQTREEGVEAVRTLCRPRERNQFFADVSSGPP